MQFKDVEDLAPLILPAWDSLPGNGAPGVKLWSGWLAMPAAGSWKMECTSMQGVGDLQRMMREGTVSVKGKLPTRALLKFFNDLKSSRSRTVTVAVMRMSTSMSADDQASFVEVRAPPAVLLRLATALRSFDECTSESVMHAVECNYVATWQ